MYQPVYQPSDPKKPRRSRGGFGRFVRGYLMVVGAITTIAGLVLLLVMLLVEINRWIPPAPIV